MGVGEENCRLPDIVAIPVVTPEQREPVPVIV